MHRGRTTLTKFMIEEQRRVPGATGDFTDLLNDVATACKVIGHAVRMGPLSGSLGVAGTTNVQGEAQKTLDLVTNDVMIKSNSWSGHLAAMVSEEVEEFVAIPDEYPRGKYLLLFDPLDGSTNIDVNVSVGTIFSILKSPDPSRPARAADFLQPGTSQVAAGFAFYGPATILVLTTGQGVNGFTLDHDIGEFILTHPRMTIPEETQEFAINASNSRFWEPPVKRYVDECLSGRTGPRGRDYNMRWIACLVAEAYRILNRGGVVLYPVDERNREQGGRLRLLYENNPVAFLVEQAGGLATTGRSRVMDAAPSALHQRAPLIFGSRTEIERVVRYHEDYVAGKDPERFDLPLFSTRSLFRNS